jgi:hypothetical protein
VSPRPPRGEWTGKGRASRKAAEQAWKQEFAVAERRGADRLRRRLEAIPHEQHRVVDGVEYVEWSAVVSAMSHDEVSESAPAPAAGEEGPAPTATSG